MPSVEMRRSTRVFGARVLRSGRRLWTEPHEGSKYTREANDESEWNGLLDNSVDGDGEAVELCKDVHQESKKTSLEVDIIVKPSTGLFGSECSTESENIDRMYGLVYRRKRRRVELTSSGLTEDKRFGKKFARHQWRRKRKATGPLDSCPEFRGCVGRFRQLAIISSGPSYNKHDWVASLLRSVLNYMTRVGIGVRRLSAFLRSQPIFDAYASHGMLFLPESSTVKKPGVCLIWESRFLIPQFEVNFSAIPFCFRHMHTSMYIRSGCVVIAHSVGVSDGDERESFVEGDAEESSSQKISGMYRPKHVSAASEISPNGVIVSGNILASGKDVMGRRQLPQSANGLPKSTLRTMQLRSSRKIQKRRSSLRRKRGRPPSAFRTQKASGLLASDFVRIRQEGAKISTVVPNRVLRSSNKSISPTTIKELKSSVGVLTQDMCANSCSANLLIIEPDRCYREEGVTVTLELSASKQWFIAVKKEGKKRYSLNAQKVMRPSCSNRFTHATVWAGDGGWRLEFPNKQDWLIFKELYKKCFDRNVQSLVASVIPVPGIQEVYSPADSNYLPFVRPDSYITVKDDELSRALVRKVASYDMDSEDEDWLDKLNDKLCTEREPQELITPERFELIIDALEKGSYHTPDEYPDEQAAYEFCLHLERKEVLDCIRSYWSKKRKQSRSALVRIYQLYQPKRTQVIPKSVLRKKRSFKRQSGRCKQRTYLQAMVAARSALEQQNNFQKVQEAKAVAERSEEFAVLKRQRAQRLMENADLATYKAAMAIRIAEAAQVSEGSVAYASFFIGLLTE